MAHTMMVMIDMAYAMRMRFSQRRNENAKRNSRYGQNFYDLIHKFSLD